VDRDRRQTLGVSKLVFDAVAVIKQANRRVVMLNLRHRNARSTPFGRLTWVVALFLLISNLALCAEFAPSTHITLFYSSTGQWALATFDSVRAGNEFVYGNQLYRLSESGKAEVVPGIDSIKLFGADGPLDKSSRRPTADDAVQILDENKQCARHALLSSVQSGTTVRFQGKAYKVGDGGSLSDTGTVFQTNANSLQRIEITKSSWQHVMDRHMVGGAKSAGTSDFHAGVDVASLVYNAQIVTRVRESNGYFKRVCDAGRVIGANSRGDKGTSTYYVITTQEGKLVTTYPVVR
jgi:hypothetical protein